MGEKEREWNREWEEIERKRERDARVSAVKLSMTKFIMRVLKMDNCTNHIKRYFDGFEAVQRGNTIF